MNEVTERELRLSAYLDGELSPAEAWQVRKHLTRNPEDADLLEQYRLISQCLKADARDEAITGAVREVIQQERRRDARREILLYRLAPALVVTVLLVWLAMPVVLPAPTLTADELYGQYLEAVSLQGRR